MSPGFPRHPNRSQVAKAARARAVVVSRPRPPSGLKRQLLVLVQALAKSAATDEVGVARAFARIGQLSRADLRRVHCFARTRNWTPTAQGLDLCAARSRACHE